MEKLRESSNRLEQSDPSYLQDLQPPACFMRILRQTFRLLLWLPLLFAAAFSACGAETMASRERAEALQPCFTFLRLGEIHPGGWIQEQMLRDLRTGFAGHLDQLYPKEAGSDVFASGRRVNSETAEGSGQKADRDTAQADLTAAKASKWREPDWWAGETEGNWRAGFIKLAYLSGDEECKRKADQYVDHVLAAQDTDGYMGIHSLGTRYPLSGGELWSQTCLFRGLLDYAELTDNKRVLDAVERAANLTIETVWPVTGKQPIIWRQTHDLMFEDVVERLYDLTGDSRYRDFGVALYIDFSKHCPRDDSSLTSLLSRQSGFVGHAARAYEHIRVPLWLWYATGRPDFGQAWRNAKSKLDRYTYPGGAAVGEEDIRDLEPDPTLTEFENCEAKETQWDLESALQKTGIGTYADRVEQIWFNDEQGAREADGSALTYLTCENRFRIDATAPDGKGVDDKGFQPRNILSPTGGGMPCCCPPNASQVSSLYVRGMWMRHGEDGLAALLYGPCTVSTRLGATPVRIEEDTDYPFGNTITLKIEPEHQAHFTLLLRNPGWSRQTTIDSVGARIETENGGYWRLSKEWQPGDIVRIRFAPAIREIPAVNGQVALQYGALLFALPIPGKKTVVRTYPVAGFADTYIEPAAPLPLPLALPVEKQWNGFGFKPQWKSARGGSLQPFDTPAVTLEGTMIDSRSRQYVPVTLVPLGNANELRQITFPLFP